jgi:hypothetical protein
VTLHNDLLLGLVHDLETLVEKGGGMLFIGLLGSDDFHGWAVIANFSSYIIGTRYFEYESSNIIKMSFNLMWGTNLLFLSTETSVGG